MITVFLIGDTLWIIWSYDQASWWQKIRQRVHVSLPAVQAPSGTVINQSKEASFGRVDLRTRTAGGAYIAPAELTIKDEQTTVVI